MTDRLKESSKSGILCEEWPAWLIKAALRMAQLPEGRHEIIFTKTRHYVDLSVRNLGKIEHLELE